MDLLFDFAKPAVGKGLVGRREEISLLVNSLTDERRGAAFCDGAKSGRATVIRNALSILKDRCLDFVTCELNLFNVRSYEDFIRLFREVITGCYNDVNRHNMLPFTIDFSGLPDDKILEVPQLIAEESGRNIIIVIKEFQNLAVLDGNGFSLADIDAVWTKQKSVRFIFTGSSVNVMKDVFEDRKLFYYITTLIKLKPLDRGLITEYIVSTCLNAGRVIGKDVAEEICRIAGDSIWYVKQICSICYSFPIGYITLPAVKEAENALIGNYLPHFTRIMADLTPNQINFLKAALEGVRKFSSQEILDRYHLNSSANVFRIKDALRKKEVLTFEKDDSARILDPLFEYWLRNYYFKER